MSKVKTHFVFPEEVLKDIDSIAGERKRSSFVVQAAVEKVEREKLRAALKRAKGLWKEEDYPEMKTIEDIDRWVTDLRRRDLKRQSGVKVG